MLEKGASYPSAMSQLVMQKYGSSVSEVLDSPNNTLAVEYIKALSALNSDIRPFTVKRKNAEHDGTEVKDNFASASFIRQNIDNPDCSSLMPESVYASLKNAAEEGKYAHTANLEKAVLYKLRSMTPEQLRNIPDVSHGLEYRIHEARSAVSVKEAEEKIKTRRYTMARVRRIMLCALLTTRTKFQYSASPSSPTDPVCLGRDQALMIDGQKRKGLNQLCLNGRSANNNQRLSGKYRCSLRDRINITCKVEIL